MIDGMWVFAFFCILTVIFCAIQTYHYRKNKPPTLDEINEKFKKELYEDLRKEGYDI
jgi:hypothetical protein